MIQIQPLNIDGGRVTVPGSKSYTHRVLIAAALSNGVCTVSNALRSEDTELTLTALKQMGARIDENHDRLTVNGCNGRLKSCQAPIFLGNSGTSMRLLTGVAVLGEGSYILTGTERMQERPVGDLLDSLNRLGIRAHSVNRNGCPPVRIEGGKIKGGRTSIDCRISSQYLSALLLMGPCTTSGLEVTVTQGPVSKPYVDMTVDILEQFGIRVKREGYHYFKIDGNQAYGAGSYNVESDCSQAGYFWAAAAITGARIVVAGINPHSRQGDLGFVDLLEIMGCAVEKENEGIAVRGGPLRAIETDMAHMPDMVPTLAVVAAFAQGTTVIKNVAHLKAKESDRLNAVAQELKKMGIDARSTDDGLKIVGGRPQGAEIDTYDDHRIAMSFAVAGLKASNTVIRNEHCVAKSFPNFWEVLAGLYPNKNGVT
jgi:3-phosphoshikimate 1-carboxyvinyltransferase